MTAKQASLILMPLFFPQSNSSELSKQEQIEGMFVFLIFTQKKGHKRFADLQSQLDLA